MTTLSRFADARVFVIDDNATNVSLLEGLLRRAGLRTIFTATDPRDALARFDEVEPDLVLLDLHMPHIDGYTILQNIVERAAGSYLPVMVLTADARPEANERALTIGARDFLTKPFDATEVILRARNLLETRYLYVTLRQHNVALGAELGYYRESERVEREALDLQRERIARVMRDDQIRMVYQPVLDITSGALVGVEALARFPADPAQGPDRWFSEADDVGLGTELELHAVNTALTALDRLPVPAFLAVNVSPATLLSGQLDAAVSAETAPRLVIELTEHVPVEDYETVNTAAQSLRQRGARVAIDDTGAGYAGFRHLISLNPDIVKLDISLTRGIDHDPGRRALASALVQFTRDTGAELIAEGIETGAELDALRQLHVGWSQGYYLGRPESLDTVLSSYSASALSGCG